MKEPGPRENGGVRATFAASWIKKKKEKKKDRRGGSERNHSGWKVDGFSSKAEH